MTPVRCPQCEQERVETCKRRSCPLAIPSPLSMHEDDDGISVPTWLWGVLALLVMAGVGLVFMGMGS